MSIGTMMLVDGVTQTWECRICGHRQVIHGEAGLFSSSEHACPNGCKFKKEREFFTSWKVRLLKPMMKDHKMRALKAGEVVDAEIFPHGKIYLMHPDCEIPTAFNVDAIEGQDFEEIEP